jgi:hypothetical protein
VSCHATAGALDSNEPRISRDLLVRVAASAAHPANLINVVLIEISPDSRRPRSNGGTERADDFVRGDDRMQGGTCMRGLFALGIVLLLVGLAVLAWPAIPYTERKKAVDIGPIEVQTETEKHVFVPPLVGIAAAASGVALIALGRRNA